MSRSKTDAAVQDLLGDKLFKLDWVKDMLRRLQQQRKTAKATETNEIKVLRDERKELVQRSERPFEAVMLTWLPIIWRKRPPG
ncbi:hypothetical protein [Dechloromonas sp. CZR5]|uniref:hypothetical protein n=1 Tax=Dechloromonas sp. CZR5 TaxID=2608630 RepID=UPI00123CC989|nr:hypothetical protein [Dechloromonas sp. CZR5]